MGPPPPTNRNNTQLVETIQRYTNGISRRALEWTVRLKQDATHSTSARKDRQVGHMGGHHKVIRAQQKAIWGNTWVLARELYHELMIRDFILFVVGEYVCSIVGGVGSHPRHRLPRGGARSFSLRKARPSLDSDASECAERRRCPHRRRRHRQLRDDDDRREPSRGGPTPPPPTPCFPRPNHHRHYPRAAATSPNVE